jgi:hypothetical protein
VIAGQCDGVADELVLVGGVGTEAYEQAGGAQSRITTSLWVWVTRPPKLVRRKESWHEHHREVG